MVGCKRGIVTFPVISAGSIPLHQLVDVLSAQSSRLTLISGRTGYSSFAGDGRLRAVCLDHVDGGNGFFRVMNYLITQLRIARSMLVESGDVDQWIFFIGGETLVIPMVVAKLGRKKVILIITGSTVKTNQAGGGQYSGELSLLSRITYMLSDRIVAYTPSILPENGLEAFKEKVEVLHRHFVDLDTFQCWVNMADRPKAICYVGRLSPEKGILNLVQSLAGVKDQEVTLTIAGDGVLRSKIDDLIASSGLEGRVVLKGWVPHEQLPEVLNHSRLLVLPSLTEGLPNVILEAMACGTPALATSVGSVPDIITDGVNGFLMEDNSVDRLSYHIERAVNHPDLAAISERGLAQVRDEFNYKVVSKRWEMFLSEVERA